MSSTYYDRLIGQASISFANLVHNEECVEDELKTGKIKDYHAIFEQSSIRIGGLTKKIQWKKIEIEVHRSSGLALWQQ